MANHHDGDQSEHNFGPSEIAVTTMKDNISGHNYPRAHEGGSMTTFAKGTS